MSKLPDSEKIARSDLAELLQNPAFRRFVWRLLGSCRVYQSSHTGEPVHTAFFEGQRSVGLRVLDEIRSVRPQAYPQMMMDLGGADYDRSEHEPGQSDDADADAG